MLAYILGALLFSQVCPFSCVQGFLKNGVDLQGGLGLGVHGNLGLLNKHLSFDKKVNVDVSGTIHGLEHGGEHVGVKEMGHAGYGKEMEHVAYEKEMGHEMHSHYGRESMGDMGSMEGRGGYSAMGDMSAKGSMEGSFPMKKPMQGMGMGGKIGGHAGMKQLPYMGSTGMTAK